MIDFKNYAGIPLSFGRGVLALLTERGKVKPVDYPLVDDRPRVQKAAAGRSGKREEILVSQKLMSLGVSSSQDQL